MLRRRSCLLALVGVLLLAPLPAAAEPQHGSVLAWGCRDYRGKDYGECTVPAAAASGVTAIAAGSYHSLALTKDGHVLAWGCRGDKNWGQCTVPAAARSGVTAIAAGGAQSLAITRNGRVLAWGCGGFDDGQCSVPGAAYDGVKAIAAGIAHSLALKKDGRVLAWGCDIGDLGQCTVPAEATTGVTAISAGADDSLALRPLPCTVPTVVDKKIGSAKLAIAQGHCVTGKVRHAYSRKRKKGIVISQSRRPGQVLPADAKIDLVVSRGRRP